MFGHSDNNQPVNGQSGQNPVTANDPAMANDQMMTNGSLEESPTSTGSNNDYGMSTIPTAPIIAFEPPTNPISQPPMVPTSDITEPSQASDQQSNEANVNESSDDLLDLKQKALHELSPLVNHLDQSPEEKFKTTMMMIQASDDQSLLTAAYEAAQAIPDEKAKAQALLDVVNEINYFTQAH